jgi:hypothetical protein
MAGEDAAPDFKWEDFGEDGLSCPRERRACATFADAGSTATGQEHKLVIRGMRILEITDRPVRFKTFGALGGSQVRARTARSLPPGPNAIPNATA